MTDPNRTTFSSASPIALFTTAMSTTSTSDIIILALGVGLAAAYLFRDQLSAAFKPKVAPVVVSKGQNGSGNPRDFIAKMKEGVSCLFVIAFQSVTWLLIFFSEKASGHLLRFANRHGRGICYTSCERSQD